MKKSCRDSFSSNVSLTLSLGLLLSAGIPLARSATIINLPTLGGDSVAATAINDRGHVVGFSLTAGNAEQHAFLHTGAAILDLPTLGGSFGLANGVNHAGQVIGDSTLPGDWESHGFVFDGTSVIDLGTLGGTMSSAVAINRAGQVAGNSTLAGDFELRAFLYGDGLVTPISTLGGSWSYAVAINNPGQVAGYSYTPGNWDVHPFLFGDGALIDLGTLGGPSAVPAALNDAGWVVGESDTTNGETHAFLYAAGTMIDLGTLGGTYSTAYAVNQSGQIIGDASRVGDIEFRAFLHTGGRTLDLGTLGGAHSSAYALNNRGQVVGEAEDAAGWWWPFLWQNGAMVKLNTLLPPDSGWELSSALFINDAGQIVGYGTYGGQFHWYLLTPGSENQPPVAMAGEDQRLECPGIVTLDGSASTDPDGDTLTYEWRENDVVLGTAATASLAVPPGTHTFTLKVADPNGGTSEDSVEVTLADTTTPAITSLSASPDVLSPANRSWVAVTVTAVASDNCDPAPVCRIVGVTSDEPETGPGDNTSPDWAIIGALTLNLRAERSAKGDGRIYSVTVQCTDASGNASLGTVTVTVPKNPNKPSPGQKAK